MCKGLGVSDSCLIVKPRDLALILLREMRKLKLAALDIPQGCKKADVVYGESLYIHLMPNFLFDVQTITDIYSTVLFDIAISIKSVGTQLYTFK